MIIGLSGYAKSGKDTVAKMIQALTAELRQGQVIDLFDIVDKDNDWYITDLSPFVIKKFSFKLKLVAQILTGISAGSFEKHDVKDSLLPDMWNRDNVEIVEGVMRVSRTKGYSVREFLQDLGTDAVRDNVHPDAWVNALMSDYKPGHDWIVTDVRFPNEAAAIKRAGGFIVRVERPMTGPTNEHESETAMNDWDFDYKLWNDGDLDDLLVKVDKEIVNRFIVL